jgi:hypothetical protein
MDNFVTMDFVHKSLMLGDEIKFDEVISYAIEPNTSVVFGHLRIQESDLPQIALRLRMDLPVLITTIQELIATRIGCQIIKKDPEFGQKLNRWRVGNADEGFQRRVDTDMDDWCTYYNEMLLEVESMTGTGHMASGQRRGIYREYNEPF